MAQAQAQGGAASDTIAALATELIQYIGAAETRYLEGVDAGNAPLNKNARQAALAEEVATKIKAYVASLAPPVGAVAPTPPPPPPPASHR